MKGVNNGLQEIPNASLKWYISSTRNSLNIRQTLEKQFSIYTQKEREKISRLIEVFGFENFPIVHDILGKSAQEAYSFEFYRLKNVKIYCLSDLLNEQTFDLIAINKFKLYDHISAHSSKDTKHLVLADIKIYLTSVCMPAPEAKALGCYKFDKLKECISAYDTELQNAITRLFIIAQIDNQFPTIREEQLLCKHASVIGGEKSLNWGSILYLWLLTEKPNGKLLEWLKQRSSIYQLLSKAGTKKNPTNISFKDYVIKNTVIFLFAHKNSIFVPPKKFLEELKKIFLESESNRQNVVYFIDYLYDLLQKKDEFPIEKSLFVLKQLVEDEKTFLYDFLHAVLYYFYYYHRFSIFKDHRALVFQSIWSVLLQERKKIVKIKDPFIRESLVIKENILNAQRSKDSLYYLGFIFLRQLVEKGDQKCPYMSVNKHFEFIKSCEIIIKGPLPKEIVTSILLHQTLMPQIEDSLMKIIDLTNEIGSGKINFICHWETVKTELLYYMGKVNLEGINDFDLEKKRLMRMEQLSYLLLFSTHPSFKEAANRFEFDEFNVYDGKMALKKELLPVEEQVINYINNLSIYPLDQGLVIISTLIENHKNKIYDLFNAYIYYSHLYKKEFGSNGDDFLFSSIYEMSLEQRKIFETPIEEKGIVRGPWEIDFELLDFADSHLIPLSEWGKIFLRSSPYLKVGNENTNSNFLTLNKHIELIKRIEEFFGSTLDPQICADLLYFQMANNSMFDLIEQFESTRNHLKDERTKWPALTYDSYLETINSAKIFESIKDVSTSTKLCASNDRSDFFMTDVVGPIAMALAFATYPIPLISFKELIKNAAEIKLFHPMHDLFPKGPAWTACWEKNEEECLYTLSVAVTNSEKCNSYFIQFDVPLKVPKNVEKRKEYLLLLFYAVDNLGKEVFPDDEFEKLEKMHLDPPKLTQDILYKDNGKERLNALLECSPFVKLEWQKFFPFVEDDKDYEINLFIFVQTLRRKFLDSFYYILDPEKGELEEGLAPKKDSEIQIISKNEKEILEEDFIL